jgi:hypothetical protein
MEKIKEVCEMIEDEVYEQFKHKGIEKINADEMGKVSDILKDFKMAMYYHDVVNAMEHESYEMTLEEFKRHSPEYYRDMDRHSKNVMYYTEPIEHEKEVSKTEKARQKYHEEKTQENFDHYSKEIVNEMVEVWGMLDNAEKTMLKSRISALLAKMNA